MAGVRDLRRARRPQARSESRAHLDGAGRARNAGHDRLDRADEHRTAEGRRDPRGRRGLGAVGSVVGQLAKLKGCRAVGIAGGERKCRYVVDELGFDACIDHRRSDFPEALKAACPKGIDVYFENVGGAVFDAVLPLLNTFARVPVCGLIAHYNATELPSGVDRVPLLMRQVLTKRLTLRGFIVFDFANQQPDFLAEVGPLVRDGRIKYREDIVDGLENAPRALIGLLRARTSAR